MYDFGIKWLGLLPGILWAACVAPYVVAITTDPHMGAAAVLLLVVRLMVFPAVVLGALGWAGARMLPS
jgi:uncharacterized membrane protein